MVCTSLYADDAAVFVAPIKRDVDNLLTISRGFGKVTKLCTNFHKSLMVLIQCGNLDLGVHNPKVADSSGFISVAISGTLTLCGEAKAH